jgi:hypothetical protein
MARYSEEFKYTIIRRMMPPQNESVITIARETGRIIETEVRHRSELKKFNQSVIPPWMTKLFYTTYLVALGKFVRVLEEIKIDY